MALAREVVIVDDDEYGECSSTPSEIPPPLTDAQRLRISQQKENALARRRTQSLQQFKSPTAMADSQGLPHFFPHTHEEASSTLSSGASHRVARNLNIFAYARFQTKTAQSSERLDVLSQERVRAAGDAAMEARVDGELEKKGAVSNPNLGLEFKGLDEDGWRCVRKRPNPGHSFGIELSKEFTGMDGDERKKKVKPQFRGNDQEGEEEMQLQKEIKKNGKFSLSNQQLLVLKAIAEGKSVFVTGSAGTGKSYLLEFAIRVLNRIHGADSVFVTASTGLAACAIGGTTLHSFAGVGLGIGTKESLASKVTSRRESRKRWTKAKALVIDEISMIDGEFLDKLDFVGRSVRGSSGRRNVFGGLQLVVTGDFFQLPPVNTENDKKAFAFEANCWSRCFDLQIELTHVFRQSDQDFVALLNEVRKGMCSPETLSKLQGCKGPVRDLGIMPTRLYPHKVDVGRENDQNLRSLRRDIVTYTAKDAGKSDFAIRLLENVRADKQLDLCIGAQVMLVKNLDTEIGLVNGARGIVVRFSQEEDPSAPESKEAKSVSPSGIWPVVRFACDGLERVVRPESWSVLEGNTEVAKRIQVPLKLAWALSVHKCQGMTLDRVETDLSKAFDYGMVYVALSRVKSLDGLQLIGFDPARIKVHSKVVSFYENLEKQRRN